MSLGAIYSIILAYSSDQGSWSLLCKNFREVFIPVFWISFLVIMIIGILGAIFGKKGEPKQENSTTEINVTITDSKNTRTYTKSNEGHKSVDVEIDFDKFHKWR